MSRIARLIDDPPAASDVAVATAPATVAAVATPTVTAPQAGRSPGRRAHYFAAKVCGVAICLSAASCSSLFSEGAATTAGIGGAALASKVTNNAAVASGIGLGVLAAAEAGVKYVEKDYHGDQQDEIARIAGPLDLGKVAHWQSRHTIELEPDAQGKVTVNRVISAGDLNCKEIVFSVDVVEDKKPRSSFYVATICHDTNKWKWASAEPATERWGALQ